MKRFILLLVKFLELFRFSAKKKKKFAKGQCDDIYPHF